MPFDWITFIHREHNRKGIPHTEETKAKMRLSHADVNKRPETALNRSKGGFTLGYQRSGMRTERLSVMAVEPCLSVNVKNRMNETKSTGPKWPNT